MTPTRNPTGRQRHALWIAAMLMGGCSPPPGLIDAQPPGVDPRLKLARDHKEPAASPADTPELAVFGPDTPRPSIPPAPPTAKGEVKTTESGTSYETLREGSGETAKSGQRVALRYTGTLDDGRVFDSATGKSPITAALGSGKIITGWEEAIPGMRVGEIRKLTVPAAAGYGASGRGQIPANATLHYELELLRIEHEPDASGSQSQ